MEQETAVESQTQELQDQPTEETQVETTDEQDVQPTEVTEPEAQAEAVTQEAEPETVAEPEEEEDYFNPQSLQQTQNLPEVPQVDINQFVDAEGRIDMVGYNQAIQKQMQDQIQAATQAAVSQATQYSSAMSQYEKDWQKAEQAFPQLKGKEGKDFKDMVQAIHVQSATAGSKYLSPLKAAEKFFGVTTRAKAEGARAAQETRTVQQAATLANPNPPVEPAERQTTNKLKETMRKAPTAAQRKQAANELLADMIGKGLL